MSSPRDPPDMPDSLDPPTRGPDSFGPLGPDEPDAPTLNVQHRAEAGDSAARPDDRTLADATEVTDPALPRVSVLPPPLPRSSLAPAPVFTGGPTTYEAVRMRLRTLKPQQAAFMLAGVALFLTVVLVVTALLVGPLSALLPNTSTSAQPVILRTATPLPTVTPSPSPTATPPPAAGATFVALDTSTQGNWQGVYGSAGYILAGDTAQLPAAIQVTPAGGGVYTWDGLTDDPRALVTPENAANRIAACWYAPTSFMFDVTITDGHTYQLALYLLDWDQQQRVETVSVIDPTTGTALDTRPASTFAAGAYFVWQVRGHVTIQVTNAAGSPNAVVSAIFFALAA